MTVRVLFLLMERGVPAQVFRANPHLAREVVAVRTQEIHPLFRGIVTETLGVFTVTLAVTNSLGAEAVNPWAEKWLGHRVPNAADCTTILYELGKNTYDAISQMSAYEKQEAIKSGQNIQNLGALFIDLNMGNRWGKIVNDYKGK